MLPRRDQHPGRDPFGVLYISALDGNIAPFLWPWEIAEWVCASTSAARSPWSFCKLLQLSRTEIWERVNARLGVGVICSGEEAYRRVNWLDNGHRSRKDAVAVFHKLAQRSIPVAMRLLTEDDSFWEQYLLPRCHQSFAYAVSNHACWGGVANAMVGAVHKSSRRSEDRQRRERLLDDQGLSWDVFIRRRLFLLEEFMEMASNEDADHVWQCLLAASTQELSPPQRAKYNLSDLNVRCVI